MKLKNWVTNWMLGRSSDIKDRSAREQLFSFVFTSVEFGGIHRRAHPKSRILPNQNSFLLTPSEMQCRSKVSVCCT